MIYDDKIASDSVQKTLISTIINLNIITNATSDSLTTIAAFNEF